MTALERVHLGTETHPRPFPVVGLILRLLVLVMLLLLGVVTLLIDALCPQYDSHQ